MAAAAAIMANYEIGHNLKRMKVKDPFLAPTYSLCEGLIRLLPWMIFLSSVIKITLCKLCGGQAARDNDAVSIVSTRSENFVYYFLTYHRL